MDEFTTSLEFLIILITAIVTTILITCFKTCMYFKKKRLIMLQGEHVKLMNDIQRSNSI